MEHRGYTARVEFDSDAGILHGEVEGIRDVVTFEASGVEELLRAFRDSVDDYLAMCAERGEEPDKAYSGKFVVRLDPDVHREAAIVAAREGKSLNAFALEAIADRLSRARKGQETHEARTNAFSSERSTEGFILPSVPAVNAVSENRPNSWATRGAKTPSTPTARTPAAQTPSSNTPSRQKVA